MIRDKIESSQSFIISILHIKFGTIQSHCCGDIVIIEKLGITAPLVCRIINKKELPSNYLLQNRGRTPPKNSYFIRIYVVFKFMLNNKLKEVSLYRNCNNLIAIPTPNFDIISELFDKFYLRI